MELNEFSAVGSPLSPCSGPPKWRSMEPLVAVPLWEAETQEVILNKGDAGLGFSVLDYQVGFYFILFFHYNRIIMRSVFIICLLHFTL